MPPMRTTSSRRATKRTAKKRTNPKRKYTNIFKRLTEKQYHNISTRNPNIPYPDELGPLAQAPKIRDHLYRIRASYEFRWCSWLLITYPIAFQHEKAKKNWMKYIPDGAELATFSSFYKEAQLQRPLRIGFFTTWEKSWVQFKGHWSEISWHAWLAMVETTPNGKRLFLYDCNTNSQWPDESTVPVKELLGMQRKFITYLQEKRKYNLREIWIGGGGNVDPGFCMSLTSAFLQHLLSNPVHRQQWPWNYSYLVTAGFKRVITSPTIREPIDVVAGPLVQLTFDPHNLERGLTPAPQVADSDEEENALGDAPVDTDTEISPSLTPSPVSGVGTQRSKH